MTASVGGDIPVDPRFKQVVQDFKTAGNLLERSQAGIACVVINVSTEGLIPAGQVATGTDAEIRAEVIVLIVEQQLRVDENQPVTVAVFQYGKEQIERGESPGTADGITQLMPVAEVGMKATEPGVLAEQFCDVGIVAFVGGIIADAARSLLVTEVIRIEGSGCRGGTGNQQNGDGKVVAEHVDFSETESLHSFESSCLIVVARLWCAAKL